MSLMSRNKGKRAEREVIHLLQPTVDKVYRQFGYRDPVTDAGGKRIASVKTIPQLQRNTMQSDVGGFDIAGLEWLALEVKFHASGYQSAFWTQTERQAKERQVPVLFYRRNNVAWRVRMRGGIGCEETGVWAKAVVDIDVETFLVFFEERLVHALSTGGNHR